MVESYGDWLESYDWNFYCTFTTDYTLSVTSARTRMELLTANLKRHLGNVSIYWVSEPFDTKYGCHTHALIKVPEHLVQNGPSYIERNWHKLTRVKKFRGYNKTHIQPYIKGRGAHYYLGKYLHRHNADFDFSFQ